VQFDPPATFKMHSIAGLAGRASLPSDIAIAYSIVESLTRSPAQFAAYAANCWGRRG
jgi:hypothetical protein